MRGNTYDNHTGRSPIHTSSVVPVLMQNATNTYRGMEVTLLTSAQLHTLVALFLVILDRLAVTLAFQYVFLLIINISLDHDLQFTTKIPRHHTSSEAYDHTAL
jgi:hypothetical protein